MTSPTGAVHTPGRMVYIVTHESRQGRSSDGYLRNVRELHRRVADEAARLHDAAQKTHGETIARESQVTYGALSQFLVTPLKSDQLEVKKILVEALGRAIESGGAAGETAYCESRLSRTMTTAMKSPELQRAFDAWVTYSRGLGFHPESGEIYESDFILENVTGFDIIEHIVRDRMGIYEGPHGTHIAEAGAWTFAAYNIVTEHRMRNDAPSILVEFPFSKPSSQRYDVFRSGLERIMEGTKAMPAVMRVGLWQRKLGLGPGREFLLRLECSDFEGAAGSGLRMLPILHEIVAPSDASIPPTIMIIMKEILSPL